MTQVKSISSITLIKKKLNDFNEAIESTINILDEHSRKFEKIDIVGDARLLRKETFKSSNTMKKLDILLKDLQNFESTWIDLPEAGHLYNEVQMLKLRVSHSKESFANLIDRKVIINTAPNDLNTEETPVISDNQSEQLMLQHELIEDIKNKKRICDSYLQLQRDIRDLDETMRTFANLVTEQDETIDNIEANIETALVSMAQGTRDLSKAAKLKRAFVPVTSAVVAGCVGGPVGAIMGLKVGILAAIGSAAVGYGGGKLIQKVNSKTISEADSCLAESDSVVESVNSKRIESNDRKQK